MILKIVINFEIFILHIHTTVKSKIQSECCLKELKHNDIIADTPSEVCNLFNKFFTSLKSESSSELEASIKFAKHKVKKLPQVIKNKCVFSFKKTSHVEVEELVDELSNDSAAGISGINIKVIKHSSFHSLP